ncbi:uncharacterized protein KIAA0513 isoform X1 [Acipenser ruthenus]|uniref:uncharacterized protein KIAA0513 isoform X1 n=1 Tax=Acipenser ruthenus TaxID=7906 RepID=UPI00145A0444|nr:uncharacterized protein KIAA0513 isoform X1 [Acipenser ruthenus]
MSMEVESVPVDNLIDFDPIPCGVDPCAVNPCTVDPCTLDPFLLDPYTVDPCVLDSHALDPCTVDPCVLDSHALDPCKVDPCVLDPHALDPCTVDPCVLDPHALDPCTVDPCVLEPSPPVANHNGNGHGHGEDPGNESEATESADSENEASDSPSRSGWSHSQRSSSNESFSSNLSTEFAEDEESAERREFIKKYVEKIFHRGDEIEQEEKARFGELCSGENGKGREWFSKYVSAQRCNSKCVSEQTFYRLVQSFAVVLFECYQMDDFGPAKNLMTMCFTYYYIGKTHLSPTDFMEKPAAGIDSYLKTANSWLAGKKDIAERLLKNTSSKTENVKGFFGGLESKLRGPVGKKNEDGENQPEKKPKKAVVLDCPDEKKGEKIYLYTHLRQQPIWHTLRFWNAAFFDAVHCERRKRSPTTRRDAGEEKEKREKWCHMSQEEKDDSLRFNENIAFGQLGTFTHNMLAFGLSRKLCNDFLKKQAIIGNLNEEQNKLLSDHIEEMAVE